MKTSQPINELLRMSPSELRRDLKLKHAESARMRIAIEMQSEKNHALYRFQKRDIARMTMVLRQMEKKGIPAQTVASPAKETPVKASQKKKKSVQGSRSTSRK